MFEIGKKYKSVGSFPAMFVPLYIGEQCAFGLYHRAYTDEWIEDKLPHNYVQHGYYVEVTEEEHAQWYVEHKKQSFPQWVGAELRNPNPMVVARGA